MDDEVLDEEQPTLIIPPSRVGTGTVRANNLPAPVDEPEQPLPPHVQGMLDDSIFASLPYKYSPAERQFILEYVRTNGQATKAYRAAFDPNNEKPAPLISNSAWALLLARRIRVAIQIVQEKLAIDLYRDTEWNKVRVISELSELATASIDDVISWTENGATLLPDTAIPAGARKAIKKIRVVRKRLVTGRPPNQEEWEIENLEVQMHDRLQALQLIGKELGMFAQRVIHSDNEAEEVRRLAEEAGVPAELAVEVLRSMAAKELRQ